MNREKQRLAAAFLIGVAHVWGTTLFDSGASGYFTKLVTVLAVTALGYFGLEGRFSDWRWSVPFAVFGTAAAFFKIAGRTVDTGAEANPWKMWLLLPFIWYAAVFTLCACGLCVLLGRRYAAATPAPDACLPRKTWIIYLSVIMLFWIPVILSFGPVILSPDSRYIIRQALGEEPLTDVHPVLYTLALRLFLKIGIALGDILIGGYLFGLFQSFFLAGVVSYLLYWLRKRGCPAAFVWLSLALFILTPGFAGLSITLWKDIPLNACLLLFTVNLYEIYETDGQWLCEGKKAAAFMTLCVAICFLRANGYHLVVICLCLLAIAFKNHRKRCAALFLPLIVIIPVIRGPVYNAVGLKNLGSVELAAVMIQQVANAVVTDAALTVEQTEFLEQIMPIETIKQAYVYGSVDPLKYHPEFDRNFFNENFNGFVRLWFELLPENTDAYLTGWLRETMGYWKPGFATSTGYYVEEVSDYRGLKTIDVIGSLAGRSPRRILHEHSNFISLGTLAHLTAFCAAFLIAERRGRAVICLTPVLVLWAGLMLIAPVYAEYRYMLVAALALPLLLFLLFFGPARPEKASPE